MTDVGVLIAPRVPGGHALLEHRKVLVVRHGPRFAFRLSAPILLGLSLHRRRCGILELEPILRSAGSIAGAEPLRHDAFEAHLAGVAEYALAIMSEVLVQTQPRKAPTQQARQRRLARLRSAHGAGPARRAQADRGRTGPRTGRRGAGAASGRPPRGCRRRRSPRRRSGRTRNAAPSATANFLFIRPLELPLEKAPSCAQ